MPLYEYHCQHCGALKDVHFHTFDESEDTPVWCGSDICRYEKGHACRMEKQLAAPAFVIHGYSARTGYATLRRNDIKMER